MAVRVEVVGVLVHFLLSALLAAVAGEDVLVVVEVVVIVLVEEGFRHICCFGDFLNVLKLYSRGDGVTGDFV